MTLHVVGPDGTLTDTSGAVITVDVIESTRMHKEATTRTFLSNIPVTA